MSETLIVNGPRLWQTLARSSEIGKGPAGGLRRLALSDADKEMRDLLRGWADEMGCTVAVDRLGSMFIRREGAEPGLAPVFIGSHLDSTIAGGRYDGVLGVLAGLEVLRALDDRGIATRRAIELVNWTNEESVRFQSSTFGSSAFVGGLGVEAVLGIADDDGLTVGEELERIGYAGAAPVGGREVDAYFELHIEQDPKLEAAGNLTGVVTGAYPTAIFKVEISGENAHIGPTPMAQRRNALIGAAQVIVALNEIGWKHAPTDGKSTATRLDVTPNRFGIIPHRASLIADMRHPDEAIVEEMKADFRAAVEKAAESSNCDIAVEIYKDLGALVFAPELVDLLHRTAREMNIATMDIRSQAAHDAYQMTTITPTAMIFTPTRNGISHNEAEDIDWDATLPGVNLLLNAVLARAQR